MLWGLLVEHLVACTHYLPCARTGVRAPTYHLQGLGGTQQTVKQICRSFSIPLSPLNFSVLLNKIERVGEKEEMASGGGGFIVSALKASNNPSGYTTSCKNQMRL